MSNPIAQLREAVSDIRRWGDKAAQASQFLRAQGLYDAANRFEEALGSVARVSEAPGEPPLRLERGELVALHAKHRDEAIRNNVIPEAAHEVGLFAVYLRGKAKGAEGLAVTEHIEVERGPVPAGDGAPGPTPIEGYPERPILEQAMEWLVRGQFMLTAQARIVRADRTWDGARFTGDVHGVKPDDWKVAHENLDRTYDALRRVHRMLAEIPRGEFIFKRAAPSLSERIEALTQEQCLEVAWLGMTERLKENPVATIKAVRSALRRLLGEQ